VSDETTAEKPRTRGRLATSAGLVLARRRAHVSDGDEDEGDAEQLKLAGFRVGGGLYGIDIMRIKEVIQAGPYPVRPVPHAPAIVEGIIALRGVVIPVVDLRKRFGVPIDPELARLNKLVIVSVRGRIVGLKVDRIIGELRVPSGAVRPAPSLLRPGGRDEFFAGVCRRDDEMVFVVNLETVIDPGTGGAAVGGDDQEEA
jgi:purine-binding chemotaxis protein CheW